jgi:hypothetical protein
VIPKKQSNEWGDYDTPKNGTPKRGLTSVLVDHVDGFVERVGLDDDEDRAEDLLSTQQSPLATAAMRDRNEIKRTGTRPSRSSLR